MLKVSKLTDVIQSYKHCVYINDNYKYNYITITNITPNILSRQINLKYNNLILKCEKLLELNDDQILIGQYLREYLDVYEKDVLLIKNYEIELKTTNQVSILINSYKKLKTDIIINNDVILELKESLKQIPLNTDYKILFYSSILDMNFVIIITNDLVNQIITYDCKIDVITLDDKILIKNENEMKNIFKGNFSFEELGIGGLDKEFEIIFRRAFASRTLPEKIVKNLGINHVRGILLYGYPGCGKTLIARQIGKILNCVEPKIVNGPSLLNKYVGESESNVRKLFEDAISDKSGSKLHLIICDEFDALVRKRGSSGDNTGTGDKIVNQFLTMIDGPVSLNNILLICLTNRKDIIDDAILRPGRLEVQIEIGLPDDKGRKDILKIHTDKIIKNGYISSNIDFEKIVEKTKNYTGAEIEGVVKNAVSYAISRELDPKNLNIKDIKPIISQDDFLKSIDEITPQFGSKSKIIDTICNKKLELYDTEYKNIYTTIKNSINLLQNGNKMSFLIAGPNYIGKTKLVSHIAIESNYYCVKFINSELLLNSYNKDILLNDIINVSINTKTVIFILDSIEKLIEYSKLGNIYNNKILQVIYAVLDKVITNENKVVFLMTSSNPELCKLLDLNNLVDEYFELYNTNIVKYFKSIKIN